MADISAIIGDDTTISGLVLGDTAPIGIQSNVLPQTPGRLSSTLSWSVLSDSAPLVPNQGFFIDSLSLMNLDLPVLEPDDRIVLYSQSLAGFRLNQTRPTDVMQVGNKRTTPGLSGGIRSTDRGDAIEIFRAGQNIVVRILSGNPDIF